MKKRTVTPQEEFTGRAPELNRTTRVRKVSAKAWIAAALSLVMSLALFGLYNLAYSGAGEKEKIVLFFCDKRYFPYVSMNNALLSADFDYDVIDIKGKHEIPGQYSGRKIVVAAFGKDAFKVMDNVARSGNADVIGYCLIDPEYPGNAALEGYGRYFPKTPVAIFGSEDKYGDNAGEGGLSMLYEKLSGADTLYGVPAVSGTVFKSKVYITPDQSRYMSVSSLSLEEHVLRYSPLFENELARYLGITYGSGISTFRLTAFFFGLSAWIGLTICVMTFIPSLAGYVKYAVVMAPAALVAAMALMRVPFLLSRKIAYKRDKLQGNMVLVPLVMGLCEIAYVSALVFAFTDISGFDRGNVKLAASLIVFVISSLSAFALARADRKSRFAGEGPASYFGNPAYFLETLIPPAALLVISIMRVNSANICYASMAVICGMIPYFAAVTIKRFSDFFEFAGVVYGILMGILVYIAL